MLLALAIVGATTVVARAFDADLTTAALLLLLAALVATLLGRAAAVVGTVAAFLALNYYFTSPTGSLDVQKEDDLAALVVFAAASAVLGWTVSRLDAARRTAEQRERETHIRLDLTTRLMAGEDPAAVVAGAADALVALFRLVRCTVRRPGATTTADGPGTSRARPRRAHRPAGGGGGGEPRAPAGELRPGPARSPRRRAWRRPSTGCGWRPRRATRASTRRSGARGRGSCPR